MMRAGIVEYLLKGAPNTEIVAAVRRAHRRAPMD